MIPDLFVTDTLDSKRAREVLRDNKIEFREHNIQNRSEDFDVIPYLLADDVRCGGLKEIEVYARVKSRK